MGVLLLVNLMLDYEGKRYVKPSKITKDMDVDRVRSTSLTLYCSFA